jgi:hypothetical protein
MGCPENMARSGFPSRPARSSPSWAGNRVIAVKAAHRKNRYIYKTDRDSILLGLSNSPGKSHRRPGITGP